MNFKKLVAVSLSVVMMATAGVTAKAGVLTEEESQFVYERYRWTIETIDSYGLSGKGAFDIFCFESGYGTSYSAHNRNNYGGLRKRSGSRYVDQTFDSYEDFVIGWSEQISKGYKNASQYADDPIEFCSYLARNGYCRDAGYMDKIRATHKKVEETVDGFQAEWKAEEKAKRKEQKRLERQAAKTEKKLEKKVKLLEKQLREDYVEEHISIEDATSSAGATGYIGAILALYMDKDQADKLEQHIEQQVAKAVNSEPGEYLPEFSDEYMAARNAKELIYDDGKIMVR